MELSIPDFPEARFYKAEDQTPPRVFLGRYFKLESRHELEVQQGYSQRVYDFKKGYEIGYFARGMRALLSSVIDASLFIDDAVLIPVPSGQVRGSPDYNDQSNGRYRDDRNIELCMEICRASERLSTRDVLRRTVAKPSGGKDHWSVAQHMSSIDLIEGHDLPTRGHVFLIDDIYTTGHTLQACANRLSEERPLLSISLACLAINC